MRKPVLLLFVAVAVGVTPGCGMLENITSPGSVWDDGEMRLFFGGPQADWAAIEKCLDDDDANGAHRAAVVVGRVLDTPISTAADVCCYAVVGTACLPLIALKGLTNSSQPHEVFAR
jgi:hypothetical protein